MFHDTAAHRTPNLVINKLDNPATASPYPAQRSHQRAMQLSSAHDVVVGRQLGRAATFDGALLLALGALQPLSPVAGWQRPTRASVIQFTFA